jgi:hypothetical protein
LAIFVVFYGKEDYPVYVMQNKAAELAAILKDKKITCIVIETPNGHDSIDEITFEFEDGIRYSVDGPVITFEAGNGTASFEILETAQIIKKVRDKGALITTYAVNGGVKIEYNGP